MSDFTTTTIGDWDGTMIVVDDPKGGRWCPSDEASDEIDASDDPIATAIRIATDEPMRGSWQD